jgi:hypothetical protein
MDPQLARSIQSYRYNNSFIMHATRPITWSDFTGLVADLNQGSEPGNELYKLQLEPTHVVCIIFGKYPGERQCPTMHAHPTMPLIIPYKALRIRLVFHSDIATLTDNPDTIVLNEGHRLATAVVSGCGAPEWTTDDCRWFAYMIGNHGFAIKKVPRPRNLVPTDAFIYAGLPKW